jgi:hypothetical protein
MPPAREIIKRVVTGTALDDVIGAAIDYDDVRNQKVNVAVRVGAVDADGRPLQNAEAYFGPAAGQGKKRVPLLNGRATLRFRRGPVPSSGPYHCPVVVEWTAAGQQMRRVLNPYFYP